MPKSTPDMREVIMVFQEGQAPATRIGATDVSAAFKAEIRTAIAPPAFIAQDHPDQAHPRYTVQVPIEIRKEGSGVPIRLETMDLSRGGCYVQLVIPFFVGTRVSATLLLDGYPITITGVVTTRHPQYGNGIMFVDFEGEGKTILRRYLEAVTA